MAKFDSFGVSPRIEWKIKNILSVSKHESDEFNYQGSCWKFVLFKSTFEGAERIRIFLREKRSDGVFSDFTSRVFIVGKNHVPQFLMEQQRADEKVLYNECIWWMNVKDFRQKEDILSTNGVVSFVCILMCEPTSDDEDRERSSVQTSINAKARGVETHLLHFRRLLDDSALSDVTLKCRDRTIPAHRVILSSRSEVFAAMLRNDMTESRRGIIEISDVDPPILEQLLQFVYSCELTDMSMDTAPQLYEAADKYGVESLKEDCSAFMKENLTKGSACRILLLADAHSDSDLKGGVVSFIVETKLFQKDEIWLKFCEDHPKLAFEVLNRVCKTLSCFV